jgi:hypothetical protein
MLSWPPNDSEMRLGEVNSIHWGWKSMVSQWMGYLWLSRHKWLSLTYKFIIHYSQWKSQFTIYEWVIYGHPQL